MLKEVFLGPIIPNYVYFYGDARYIYFGGWERGLRVFNPWDITINKGQLNLSPLVI